MTLADYTSREFIVPELACVDARGAIEQLARLLENAGRVASGAALVEAVLRREMLSSTAVAPGWALSHGRLASATELCFGLGRSRQPIDWFGAVEPVRLIFLFAVPDGAAAAYLSVISGLSRLSQDHDRAVKLLRAPEQDSILQELAQIELPSAPRRNRAVAAVS